MRFFHQGKEGDKGGTTVGYTYLDKNNKNKMLITFARCSDHPTSTDVFSKAKSRLICAGRLAKGKFMQVEKPEDMDRYEFLLRLIEENDKKVKEQYGQRLHGA